MEEPVTVEGFFKIGTSLMGLKPGEFWEMKVSVFFLMLDGWQELRTQEFRQRVELVRAQTTQLVNIQIKPEDRLKPWELWPLEWDEEILRQAQDDDRTDEEIRERNRELMAGLD